MKAYGVGLLGSFGELAHVYLGNVEWAPFVLDDVIATTYNYSEMQSKLFVVEPRLYSSLLPSRQHHRSDDSTAATLPDAGSKVDKRTSPY